MNRFIMANSQQCLGCHACEIACVMAHNGNNNTHIKNKVFTTKKEGRYESFYYGQQSAMSGLSCL